tara:strand:- start:803 stop:2197 length:1395 start_codon:yes stop_codon:yes gene_type:complete
MLHDFVLKFNFYLEQQKIKQQDKIFVILENSALLTALFFGITCAQRIFVPINPSSGRKEINYIFNKIKPNLIISDSENIFKIPRNLKNKIIKINNNNFFFNKIFSLEKKSIESVKKDNIAEILFTSGSTGKPKAIVLNHHSIMHNLDGIYKKIKFKKNKNFLAITPIYHNNGQFIPTLIPLLTFGKTTPSNSLTSIFNFWSLIKLKNINYTSVMVTHINYLFYNKKKISHTLEAICCGGAKLDFNIQKKFSKFFNIKILANYGLTEVSSIASTETLNKFNTGTCGTPLFNNKIYIKKSENNSAFGEICIKGKNLFKEYFKDKKTTQDKKRGKLFYTGDIGQIDKFGNLIVKDRIDSMFIVSGENIYPNEIENHANNYKGIKNSFVTGIFDKITSKKVVLIYEGKKKISSENIINFLSKKVSNFKLPKKVWHVSELNIKEIPKSPNGKILRKKFNEILLLNKKFN